MSRSTVSVRRLAARWRPPSPCLNARLVRRLATSAEEVRSRGPLSGIRVIDCSRILAGPFAAQILGDLGADVIKVEAPKTGDDTRWLKTKAEGNTVFDDDATLSNYFLSCNRNKRSITVNFKHPAGIGLMKDLISESDVLIENFIVGKMDELGIGYDVAKQINPRIIYSSISGFGSTGPMARDAGYDVIAAAQAGLMHITGEPDGAPMKTGVALCDLTTGLYSAAGIMAALHARNVTGEGQKVEASLFESTLSVLANMASSYLNSGEPGQRYGTQHAAIVPYQAFMTADSYMIVGTTNNRQFHKLCHVIGLPDLKHDPRFGTNALRVINRDELLPLLSERLKTRATSDWLPPLVKAGLPAAKVNNIKEAFDSPQAQARAMIEEVDCEVAKTGKVRLVGVPTKLSDTPGRIRMAPPRLGEHTAEILAELGYTDAEREDLREQGAI